MDNELIAQLEEKVAEILDLPDDQQAGAFDQLWDRYPEHRTFLEQWQAEATALSPGERSPESNRAAWRAVALSEAPEKVGDFRILDVLGEGGMGIVYLAEQEKPVRRRVALKLIKPGMDSKDVLARFETERQALAMMSHANIAKVHEAGLTPDGRPYFSMEHVPGVPISEYCDRQRLDLAARIELFQKVCRAVQHAHQKGIVHRDLKPGNILVQVLDGLVEPKIIDFGVAKALQQRLTERTLYTEQGRILGTPEYMSPEQAEMTGIDVDTRTDIYSLGAVLYELLAGTLPFESRELRAAGYFEMQRMIREVEPPRPSTKCSTVNGHSDVAAQRRRRAPRDLVRSLTGDLDWITMRCLEKDPARRYQSTSELAADLQRHLDDEPVTAGPPSATYRMRKFLRKRRGAVIAAAAFVLALVSGLGVALWQNGVAKDNAKLAKEREKEAERQRDEAIKVTELLSSVLRQNDSRLRTSQNPTLDQVIEIVAEKLEIDPLFEKVSLVAATLHKTIGMALRHNRKFERAEPHLEKALQMYEGLLGEADEESVAARYECAMNLARRVEGTPLSKQKDDLRKRSYALVRKNIELHRAGKTRPIVEIASSHRVLAYSNRWQGESQAEFNQRKASHVVHLYDALKFVRQLPPSRTRAAEEGWILHLLGYSFDLSLDLNQRIEYAREALRVRSEGVGQFTWDWSYSVAQMINKLTRRWHTLDRQPKDLAELTGFFGQQVRYLSATAPDRLCDVRIRQGSFLLRAERPEAAVDEFAHAITLARSIQPPPKPNRQLVDALDGHAMALRAAGRESQAAAAEAALERFCVELHNDDDLDVKSLKLFYWGCVNRSLWRSPQASLRWVHRYSQHVRSGYEAESPSVAWAKIHVADSLIRVGRLDEAEPLLMEAHELSKQHNTESSPTARFTSSAYLSLVRSLRDPRSKPLLTNDGGPPRKEQKSYYRLAFASARMTEAIAFRADSDWKRARATLQVALQGLEAGNHPFNRAVRALIKTQLAAAEQGLGRFDEAENLLREAYEDVRQSLGETAFHTAYVDCQLALLYADTNRLDDAREILTRVLPKLRKAVGDENLLVARALAKMKE